MSARWTIFNSGGAVVGEDLTLEEVRDYMTPYRFERGWNAVSCVNVTSQQQLDAITTPPQRKPLTDEQIVPMFSERQKQQTEGEKDAWYFYAWGVNDGEAAHGIKPV